MKYLQEYQEEQQTALFKKTGSFFAFSNKQFDEQKKEGIKYINMGAGLICPEDNVKELIESLDTVYKAAVAQDIAENGIDAIILRELYNHECFYTGDISDCVDKLVGYDVSSKKIMAIYLAERCKNSETTLQGV